VESSVGGYGVLCKPRRVGFAIASACMDFDANIAIAGLDPAIHLLEESFFDECAGRARA